MQRGRGILDSFPETIDLNNSFVTNNAPMDHPDRWDINVRNPVPGDGNVSCVHIDDGYNQSFGGRHHGESSSGGVRLGGSSFEPSGSSSYAGRHSYSLNHGSVNVRPNHGQLRDHDGHTGVTDSQSNNLCKSGYSEMEHGAFYDSLDNVGTSVGCSRALPELNDALGPLSCKRKAFEGTSEQLCAEGSSSSTRPMANSELQRSVGGTYPGPFSLSISPSIGRSSFPLSSVPGTSESSARNFSVNHGRHEPVSFDARRGTSVRNFGTTSGQLSRHADSSSELRSLTPMQVSLPHPMHANEAAGMHPIHSDGYVGGSSSGSFAISRDRGSAARDGSTATSSSRNNLGHHITVSGPETSNILQDQIDWSFTPGASASSRNQLSSSQRGLSSGGQASSSAWLPHENQALQNNQIPETAPWIPFAPVESVSGNRGRHFMPLPSTSSPDEGASTSHAHQLHQSSLPLLIDIPGDDINGFSALAAVDIPGDDINGFRALAAVEGRNRMMRRVFNAMRRGAHMQTEDFVLIDPFMNEITELHDRHREMRLDVDNMSYEELLALEEQIGNVSTGLSEDKILGIMKRHKHMMVEALPDMEPCCICQENYFTGDDIGILDCGHEFHTGCIKQWLTLKNLCPICKTAALNG